MKSVILDTAARFLLPLMLLFSIFLLLRGHNEPGGGFVGGLVASAAITLHAIAHGLPTARRALRIEPTTLIPIGLLIAAGSTLPSLLLGGPLMAGLWLPDPLPALGKVGTPVIFDMGVYITVVGVLLTMIFALAEGEG
jgi:multicomponent Na+:H+ antiporter subunit B